MRKTLVATLLVAVAAAQAVESDTATTSEFPASMYGDKEREPEPDEEGDSAPFTIVVEHADGWRCGGSLVSLRTALSSAWCARGRAARPPRELWALAPATPAKHAARRVARLALAVDAEGGRDADWAPPTWAAGGAWAAAAVDLAVLELEAPFGGAAHARPILMATSAAECAPRAACHAVRALGRAPRLRIVDAALVPGEACALRARGWPALRDTALCLVGPTLCASDWGAGLVCEGKLCGVVSRSLAGARPLSAADMDDVRNDTCGDTHVAQSVARWRRFLHCAHTLRACGRGGECAQLCTERRLLETAASDEPDATTASATPAPPTAAPPPRAAGPHRTLQFIASTGAGHGPTRTPTIASPAIATPTSATPSEPQSARHANEYEPNRADFKAGEYGDNAAEYGGGEDAGAAPPPTTTPATGATAAATAAAAATDEAASTAEPTAEAELAARRNAHDAPLARSAARPPRAAAAAAPLLAIAALLVSI